MKHKVTFLPDNVTVEMEHDDSLFRAAKAANVYVLSSCGGKGNCGKCKLVVKSGTVEPGKSNSYLTSEEAGRNYVLACHSRVLSDLTVEVPPESRMQAKHKIATGANTEALFKLLREAGGCLDSRIMRVYLQLKPPTLDDSISDFERIRRALDERGFDADYLHMNHLILKKLALVLRDATWKVTISLFGSGDVTEVLDIFPGDTTKQRYGAAVDIGTTTVVVYLVDLQNGHIVGTASTYNAQVKCGDDVITRIV